MAPVKQRTIPPIPMTREGYDKVKREYDELTAKRPDLVTRVKVAREMGDLSENAAYHEARKNLGDCDRQLRHLKMQLVYGVVSAAADADTAGLGSTVSVSDGTADFQFTLVGEYETNPMQGKISIKSPIGSALFGKRVGETVTVQIPAGHKSYHITKIA